MKRLALAFFLAAAGLQAAKSLEVYFIDVEGGQSTLLVTPNGEIAAGGRGVSREQSARCEPDRGGG